MDSHIVELKPAVVHRSVTKFFAQVTDLDAGQRHVVLETPDLNEEGLDPVIVVFNYETGKQDDMGCL